MHILLYFNGCLVLTICLFYIGLRYMCMVENSKTLVTSRIFATAPSKEFLFCIIHVLLFIGCYFFFHLYVMVLTVASMSLNTYCLGASRSTLQMRNFLAALTTCWWFCGFFLLIGRVVVTLTIICLKNASAHKSILQQFCYKV